MYEYYNMVYNRIVFMGAYSIKHISVYTMYYMMCVHVYIQYSIQSANICTNQDTHIYYAYTIYTTYITHNTC